MVATGHHNIGSNGCNINITDFNINNCIQTIYSNADDNNSCSSHNFDLLLVSAQIDCGVPDEEFYAVSISTTWLHQTLDVTTLPSFISIGHY